MSEPVGNWFCQLCMPSNHKETVTFIKFLQLVSSMYPTFKELEYSPHAVSSIFVVQMPAGYTAVRAFPQHGRGWNRDVKAGPPERSQFTNQGHRFGVVRFVVRAYLRYAYE